MSFVGHSKKGVEQSTAHFSTSLREKDDEIQDDREPVNISSIQEISHGGSGNSLASVNLEQLATTNLLTLRFKLDKPSKEIQPRLLKEIKTVSHPYKGFILGSDCIEPYQYMDDRRRLKVLEEKRDVYLYENGNEEYATFNEESSTSKSWKYDTVIQIQFKRQNALKIVCEKIRSLFIDETTKSVIHKWSISINNRALTQPGNLYVRGIPKDWSLEEIYPIFTSFGPVTSLKIICAPRTNRSLGYGFLSFPLGSQASHCIEELNGKIIENSVLFVNYHVERKERERIHRNNVKGSESDKDFKGIFVGNLPERDEENNLIGPRDVLQLFKDRLSSQLSDLTILSCYFPKRNCLNDTDYKQIEESDQTSSNESRSEPEDNGLKNYGFIKFLNHEQAVAAINTFYNFHWHGKNLIVNKAVQNKRRNTGWNESKNYKENAEKYPSSKFYPNFSGATSNTLGYYGSYFPLPVAAATSNSIRGSQSPATPATPATPASPEIDPTMFGYMNPYGMFAPSPYGVLQNNRPMELPLPTREQQESNLYVKHLPLSWKDEDLHAFYQQFGEIISAKIITVGGSKTKKGSDDEDSTESGPPGVSRGYGFVCFKNPLDASRAILATDGLQLSDSNTLHASFAQKTLKNRIKSKRSSKTIYNPKFLRAMREQRVGGWQPFPCLPFVPIALAMPPPDERP